MSDIKALEAQVSRLIQAGFSQVESNRELSSTVAVISAKVGQLCDDVREFIDHSNARHSESEGKIRVLERKYADVERRLKPLEEAEKARRAAPAGQSQ